MHCLMFGLACDAEQFEQYIKDTSNPYSVAHYLFETKLIEGLQNSYPISHNYILQSNNRSWKAARVPQKIRNINDVTQTIYLKYFNYPVIKYLSIFVSTCKRIMDFHKSHPEGFFILSTINYFPVALGTKLMSVLYKCKNIAIFTDCSVGYAYDHVKKNSPLWLIKRVYKGIVHKLENAYDAYILFSEPMRELVNKRNKPFCVMEGLFNPNGLDLSAREKYDTFVILYAGSLLESFGIQNAINAVKKTTHCNLEFWIVGDGPYRETLQQLAKEDDRIKFLGYMDHSKLFEIEKKAHLLINTRNPKDAYTRYSFPSKTFEYLASGTPFLSTRLDCYTDDYDSHMFFIDSNDECTVYEAIEEIVKTEPDKLQEFGHRAKQFVMTEKSPEKQIDKIVAFLSTLWQTD